MVATSGFARPASKGWIFNFYHSLTKWKIARAENRIMYVTMMARRQNALNFIEVCFFLQDHLSSKRFSSRRPILVTIIGNWITYVNLIFNYEIL